MIISDQFYHKVSIDIIIIVYSLIDSSRVFEEYLLPEIIGFARRPLTALKWGGTCIKIELESNLKGEVNLRILVLLKQVPDTDEVKLDPEKGTMIREGVGTVINPLDLHALESAIRLRETGNHSLCVVSMGPPVAEDALREAIAMGADRALLLTDRKFAGADTWATARALAAVANREGPFDIIMAGEKATDGETGQVGPETGAMLDIPVITYVSRIIEINDSSATVEREVEDGRELWRVPFPVLLSVTKNVNEPRLPTLAGKKKARTAQIERMGSAELELKESEIGLLGSPTRVVRISMPKISRKATLYEGSEVKEGIKEVKRLLRPYLEVNHE